MPRRTARPTAGPTARLVTALVTAASLSLLAGCGGSSDSPDSPPTSSAAAGPTTDPAASGDPTTGTQTTPTETTPTVPLADGPLLESDVASMRAPAGYSVVKGSISAVQFAGVEGSNSSVTYTDTPSFGELSLHEQAEVSVEQGAYTPGPKYLPDTELDGVPVYHIKGSIGAKQVLEEWGAQYDGRLVSFAIIYDTLQLDAAQQQALYDAVVPTITFK